MRPAAQRFARLRDAALTAPGELQSSTREAAFRGEDPPPYGAWTRRVRDGAASIEDAHMAELRETGLSEDQIFELTVVVAVGAAERRLRAALATLGVEPP